jgi:SAM-dependent methyltransferase
MRPYRWLAEYYDRIFQVPDGFVRARSAILEPHWPEIRSACDLACGTGRTAIELAQRGLRTCGVDLSPGMCRLAREKAKRKGLSIPIIRADMRDFRIPEPVDLVTCEFDALNHIPDRDDLPAVAASVARALNPGGYFFFDVNNREAFLNTWGETWWNETPGAIMVMHGACEDGGMRAWADVEWFIREKGCLWRRHREHVTEVCWSEREIRRTLRAAGFDRIRAWDAYPFFLNRFYNPGYRTFYLARKKPAASSSRKRPPTL